MNTKKERFAQARQISLQAYVEGHLNLKYSHHRGNEVWYFSPLNPAQKTASFHIHLTKNTWYDFATNTKGGDLTDLIALLKQCTLSEALDYILGEDTQKLALPNFSFHGKKAKKEVVQAERIVIKPLQNQALIQYLQNRKILLSIAQEYLQEAYYYIRQKHYFGLAMPNQTNGYEVANQYFKSCLKAKSISVWERGYDQYAIFEGMFDMLACLTWLSEQSKPLQANPLILHGVTMVDTALKYLETANCAKVYAFMDNDLAGKDALASLQAHLTVVDCSHLYNGFKDFNDLILNKPLNNTENGKNN
jgi:hypothetical protein